MGTTNFWKRAAALLCGGAMLLAAGCQPAEPDASGTTSADTDSSALPDGERPANIRVALDRDKVYTREDEGKQRLLCGSFVQAWYCSGWATGRWEAEMQNMVDNGMDILIVPCAASRDDNSSTIYTHFESKVENTKCSDTMVDTLLSMAQKYHIKVLLAPFADSKWYAKEFGWKKHLDCDDEYGRWMQNHAETSNALAKELYDQYKSKYPDAFYGWYFSDEMWNMSIICKETDKTRDVALDIVSGCFNTILDFYTELDPSMPLLISPFCNRGMSNAEEAMNMWIDLFERSRFRPGDIFCPQDSVGGDPAEIAQLDEWTRAYRQAADTKPGLVFWMNNENFAGDDHATIDRLKKQMDITAQYCAANVTFSWQHHYSPYHEKVNKGYSEAYHQLYTDGVLETEKPTAPKITVEKTHTAEKPGDKNEWTIRYKESTDNIGVAGFYIYRGTEENLVRTVRCSRSFLPSKYITDRATNFWIQAYDFSGNRSEKVKVEIKE